MRAWRLGRRADLLKCERVYGEERRMYGDGRYESFFIDVYNVIDYCTTCASKTVQSRELKIL